MTGSDSYGLSRRSWWLQRGGWWVAYLAIALFGTWPLALSPASTISVGCEAEATVPLLNVWTLWWNSDRLAAGFAHYWDAPIFYPTTGTFAFSEAQPTMLLLAPVVLTTGSSVLAYNLYLWLILTLNGYSARSLLLRIGHHSWLAFCGSVMCQMLPFIWWQSGVVQLTTLFGILWTIHALLDVFEFPAPGFWGGAEIHSGFCWKAAVLQGLRLGGAFVLTYLLCNYWGLFLTLLIVPSSIWLWNRSLFRVRFWLALIIAALVSISLLGPLVYVQKSLAKEHQWTRELSWIRDLSAHSRDYLDTPLTASIRMPSDKPAAPHPRQNDSATPAPPEDAKPAKDNRIAWTRVPQGEFPEDLRRDIWPLGGGSVKLCLAPFGLLVALFTRGRRRWGLFTATLGIIAYGLSLGPTVWVLPWVPILGGECPYELIQRYVPGFSLIRSPFRFAMFVQLAIVWLSVEFLDLLNPLRWRRIPGAPATDTDAIDPALSAPHAPLQSIEPIRIASAEAPNVETVRATHPALLLPPPPIIPVELKRWCEWTPLVCASLFLMTEVWPPRQSHYTCPSTRIAPAWIQWLRENSEPNDAIVCLPLPHGFTVHDYEETTLWMYWGTLHRRPLVNGYSGFFPKVFVDLKDKMNHFHRNDGDQAAAPQLKLYPWDSPGLKDLNALQPRFAIVQRTFATRDDVWQHPLTKFRWAWVTSDEQFQLDVYEIMRQEEH